MSWLAVGIRPRLKTAATNSAFGADWESTLHPLDLTPSRRRVYDRVGEDVRPQVYAMFRRVLGIGDDRREAPSRRKRARAMASAVSGGSLASVFTVLPAIWSQMGRG
ncbi:hypothetical protein [Streptomyces sp. NPDC102360]|uniref:hypothetical protein n=1 Tax=Streptomyces sp. NPDC102360 TaxID=3366160 RepID=UPI00382FE7B9